MPPVSGSEEGRGAGARMPEPPASHNEPMVLRVLVHKAEEGGYWAEVPALPGCFTQAETLEEIRARAKEAIEAYLGEGDDADPGDAVEVLEIAV